LREQVNEENAVAGQIEGEGTTSQDDGGEGEESVQARVRGQVENAESEGGEEEAGEATREAARQERREEQRKASRAAAQEMERAIANLVLSGDGEEFSPGTLRAGLPQLRGEEDRTPPRGIASSSTPRGRPVDGAE
jgi:hypothetical protein